MTEDILQSAKKALGSCLLSKEKDIILSIRDQNGFCIDRFRKNSLKSRKLRNALVCNRLHQSKCVILLMFDSGLYEVMIGGDEEYKPFYKGYEYVEASELFLDLCDILRGKDEKI